MCIVHRPDGSVINSAACLLPNSSYLAESLVPVRCRVDLASLGMIPTHRHFAQSQARTVCDKEQLNIETESIDCRSFNNRPAGAHAEGFEATLRIPEGKAGRQTDS